MKTFILKIYDANKITLSETLNNKEYKMQDILEKIYSGVLKGDLQAVKENVRSGLDAGIYHEEILNDALIPSMDHVGQFF